MAKFIRCLILSIFCLITLNMLKVNFNEEESLPVFQTISQSDENIESIYLWTEGLTTENFLRYFAFFNDKKDFVIKEIYPNYNNEILEENKIAIEQQSLLKSLDDFLQKYNALNNNDEDKVIPIKAVKIMAKKKDIETFLQKTSNILYSNNLQGPYIKLQP